MSYQSILERGFALVSTASGKLVRRAAEVPRGEALSLEFADGKVGAISTGGDAPRAPRATPKTPTGGQGSLF